MSSSEDDQISISSLASLVSLDSELQPTDARSVKRGLIESLKLNSKCRRCIEILHNLERKQRIKFQTISNHLRAMHGGKSIAKSGTRKQDPLSIKENKETLSASQVVVPAILTHTLDEKQTINSSSTQPIEPNKMLQPTGNDDTGAQSPPTENTDKFVTPLRTVKWSKAFDNSGIVTQTSNKFDPLKVDEMEIESTVPIQDEIRTKAQQVPSKKNDKPPPIVLPGHLKSHSELIHNINQIVKKKYSLKYAKKSVIIYCECASDWSNLKRSLVSDKREFHTYTSSNERTHAFVLRGLEGNISPEDIKLYLDDEYNITAREVYLMKGTFKPLYLVVLDSSYTVNNLRNKVREVLNVKVSWENRKNQREMAQCRKCQTWGHVSRNCHRNVKCSKCAGNHEITQCTPENTVKCANCNGPHRSFDTSCPVYTYRIAAAQSKRPVQQQPKKYIDAPLPARPAWGAPRNHVQMPPDATESNSITRDDHNVEASNRVQGCNASEAVGGTQSKFLTLRNKFEELESLINLDNLIDALNHYTAQLKKCRSPDEKFLASQKFFTSELKQFNI